ncbi:MAG: hypothetical protein U0031_16860 [Thermomicrobiales bacterium]
MRRLASLGWIVALLFALTAAPRAGAADVTPAATATHPVVGLWRTVVSNTGDEPFASYSTFHADGTYSEVLPDGIVISGVWQPIGERTAEVTLYVYFSIDDRLVLGEGRLTAEVDETGNALVEDGTLVGHYEDGSLAIAIESPATGVRLTVLPVEPLGTPVLPDESAAGTATPSAT